MAKEERYVCTWIWLQLAAFHIYLPEGSSIKKRSHQIQLLSVCFFICSFFKGFSKNKLNKETLAKEAYLRLKCKCSQQLLLRILSSRNVTVFEKKNNKIEK